MEQGGFAKVSSNVKRELVQKFRNFSIIAASKTIIKKKLDSSFHAKQCFYMCILYVCTSSDLGFWFLFQVRWNASFFFLSTCRFRLGLFTCNFMWFINLRAWAGMCWVCAVVCGCARVCVGVCWCAWVCTSVCWCALVCAGVPGYAWVCSSVHKCV